jgi:SAM-dependent methyltransferase
MATPLFVEQTYPEIAAGGFSRVDGTIQFYIRVNSLLRPEFRVLDLGAGRGAWLDGGPDEFKFKLRMLRGKTAEVVGQDVDPVVAENRSLDRAVVSKPGERLPFSDQYFDLILADYVLEHVADPPALASEVRRTLKPGGWFCARTPNRLGYVSIVASLIRNRSHARVLRHAQPDRREIDVFPTVFLMNTMGALKRVFPATEFDHFSYYYQAEPSYHFNSRAVFAIMRAIDWMLPPILRGNLFVFLRKH